MQSARNRMRTSILAACLIGCVTCRCALGVAGWVGAPYSVTITTHFTGASQAHSASTTLTLNHEGGETIQASVATAGDEVLTLSSGDTLTTSYKLTGAVLGASSDGDWVASSTFIEKSYTVEGAGQSQITFWVRGVSAANRANDAGTYEASIKLTVSW